MLIKSAGRQVNSLACRSGYNHEHLCDNCKAFIAFRALYDKWLKPRLGGVRPQCDAGMSPISVSRGRFFA